MTLTEIEYGAIASSAVLNNNFQYLQNKITELAALITSETSSYSSSVATLNQNITNLIGYKDSFIPTGAIIAIQTEEIPSGFLLCDGSEVRINDFQELYQVIGTTYGQSDSTTFCIPDLTGKTLFGCSENNNLGDTLEAGLPNITGEWRNERMNGGYFSGAIYQISDHGRSYGAAGDGWGGQNSRLAGFDASKSNEIYGNSNTVQPPAIVTNFIIKY